MRGPSSYGLKPPGWFLSWPEALPYGVPVLSSGVFNGVSPKYYAAVPFVTRFRKTERPTIVLHGGDYDPFACALIDGLADDIEQAFMRPPGSESPEPPRW